MGASARGIALVAVLWITILLAVIAASFASSTQTEARLARNLIENAKAEALADGAIHRAVLGLLDPTPETAWRGDGSRQRIEYGDGEVQLMVLDEDAKIDLNAAPGELLVGLLDAVGLDRGDAVVLADRILDYRDRDQEPEPEGAEDPDYLAAGLERGAKDGPFATTDELLQVLGMTQALHDKLQPFVTVHSGAEGVDPTVARKMVLRAVPGMTARMMNALRALQPGDDPFDVGDIDDEAMFDLELYFVPSRQIMYTIRAVARTQAGGVFVREALVELTGDLTRPFDVHDWRRGGLR